MDQIVTFDEWGVSGHPNHIATYKGVLHAYSSALKATYSHITGLKLTSRNLLRKFLGPFDLLFSLWFSENVVLSMNLWRAISGMYAHNSQNHLYRQVFILLSAFTYINEFEELSMREGNLRK